MPCTLRRAEVEERLDRLLRTAGESAVNRLRDDIRAIAVELGLEKEAAQLDALIGTLLGTRRSRLDSPLAIARGRGRPYDPDRMELFHLSRTGRPEPMVRVMDYAQRWTIAVDWSSLEVAERELEGCNAFLDSDEAEAEGRRLGMPG